MLPHPDDVRLKELVSEFQRQYQYQLVEMLAVSGHVHLPLDINLVNCVAAVAGRIQGGLFHVPRREFPGLETRLPSLWTRSFLFPVLAPYLLKQLRGTKAPDKTKESSAVRMVEQDSKPVSSRCR